jgi:hypothetical protein
MTQFGGDGKLAPHSQSIKLKLLRIMSGRFVHPMLRQDGEVG